MNDEESKLVDVLLACCRRLEDVEEVPLAYLNDVAKVCAHLRPLVANAATVEDLALQNLVWTTEEVVLDWVLHGRYASAVPEWLLGDASADFAAWKSALAELAEIRGEG